MEDSTSFDPFRDGRRKEDNNIASKLTAWSIQYHWVSVIILGVLLVLGFRILTPSDALAALGKTITEDRIRDSISIADLRAVDITDERDRAYVKDLLEASVVFQCLDARKHNKEDMIQTARLPCARLLREKGIE